MLSPCSKSGVETILGTKNKEQYSTGTGPSALQACAAPWSKLDHSFISHHSHSVRVAIQISLKHSQHTRLHHPVWQRIPGPHHLCVKYVPLISVLNLSPLPLNLCPLVNVSSDLGKNFPPFAQSMPFIILYTSIRSPHILRLSRENNPSLPNLSS